MILFITKPQHLTGMLKIKYKLSIPQGPRKAMPNDYSISVGALLLYSPPPVTRKPVSKACALQAQGLKFNNENAS